MAKAPHLVWSTYQPQDYLEAMSNRRPILIWQKKRLEPLLPQSVEEKESDCTKCVMRKRKDKKQA